MESETRSEIEIEGMTKDDQKKHKNSLFMNVYAILEEDISEQYLHTLTEYYTKLGLKTLMIFFNSTLTDEFLVNILKTEEGCHTIAKFMFKNFKEYQDNGTRSTDVEKIEEYNTVIRKIISTGNQLVQKFQFVTIFLNTYFIKEYFLHMLESIESVRHQRIFESGTDKKNKNSLPHLYL